MMMILAAAAVALLVTDGDTFSLDGEKIRIANIDAPEIHRAQCDAERRLGLVARRRLAQLLEGGAFEILRGDPETGRKIDRYGRTLATIRRGGRDVGEILIEDGLARPWAGRRQPWCE